MISYCLGETFPEAEIWTEQIEEGFSRPAFFVQKIDGVFTPQLGNRYLQINSYAVLYFSDKSKQDLNADIQHVAMTLCAKLKTISYNSKAAASHTHGASDITSGTLSVPRGGNGLNTLTSGSYLRGNGTSSVSLITPTNLLADLPETDGTFTPEVYFSNGATEYAFSVTYNYRTGTYRRFKSIVYIAARMCFVATGTSWLQNTGYLCMRGLPYATNTYSVLSCYDVLIPGVTNNQIIWQIDGGGRGGQIRNNGGSAAISISTNTTGTFYLNFCGWYLIN